MVDRLSTENSIYSGVDILKFLGSVMILMMHLNVFGDCFALMTRWAVPYFFIVSAYFFFAKEKRNMGGVCKTNFITLFALAYYKFTKCCIFYDTAKWYF